MTEREAFLCAILDDPEDGPRLVFADWLEERGDPHGEFIRLQCRLARLADDDPARPELDLRERRYLARFALPWQGPLQSLALPDDRPVRGFIPKVSLHRGPFLLGNWHHSPLLLEVELLVLPEALDPRVRDQIANSPRFARVTGLRFPSAPGAPTPAVLIDGVLRLLNAHHRALLRSLDLTDTGLNPTMLRCLASSPHLRGLSALRLAGNRFGDWGVGQLAASPHLEDLAELDLSRNDLGDDAARALLESPWLPRLRRLDLRHNPAINGELRQALAERFGPAAAKMK